MIKRPLNPRFTDKVLTGGKFTTIRDTAWPIGVPIMLYNWTGAAYRSPQSDVTEVIVDQVHPIGIARGDNGISYTIAGVAGVELWKAEGFESREDMDNWFIQTVKPDQEIVKHLMTFRVVRPETKVSVTIELDEVTAACLWADSTWSGKYPKTVERILREMAENGAGKYRRSFPYNVEPSVQAFRLTFEKSEVTA